MDLSGGLLGGLPLAKILLICLTWHIIQGYNIEFHKITEPESQPSCHDENPCNLFGYSVALSSNSEYIYVGAPGQDKGNGAVFKCNQDGCNPIPIQDPDAGK